MFNWMKKFKKEPTGGTLSFEETMQSVKDAQILSRYLGIPVIMAAQKDVGKGTVVNLTVTKNKTRKEAMTLTEYAESIGSSVVWEYVNGIFKVHIYDLSRNVNGATVLITGEGATRQSAEQGYIKSLEGKQVTLHVGTYGRKRFKVPYNLVTKNERKETMNARIIEREVKELDYAERQANWVKENNVKVGDKVKVMRSIVDCEEFTWPNTWNSTMEANIGNILTITSWFSQGIRHTGSYAYPFFVLEKVIEPTYQERFEAWVKENNVKVGMKVKVVRKNTEKDTWHISSREETNKYIGSEVKILSLTLTGKISIGNCILVPYSMLEIIPEPTFKPFDLVISVDSEDNLKELWHRFNCAVDAIKKAASKNVDFPKEWDAYTTWTAVNNKCKELGLRG